jgi:sulfur carrier protein ThiS adenylyltransferase
MTEFEKGIISHIGKDKHSFIKTRKIGIAGAGGLGSNCAFNLVRCGFEKFVIIDHDKIEFSNLNRQFYFSDQVGRYKVDALEDNLKRINPAVQVDSYLEKILRKEDFRCFENCDAIVEAFDSPEYKKMIVEKFIGSGILLVAASGIAGCGNSDNIRIKKIKDSFYLVGDMVSEAGVSLPPFSPCTNIAAAKQADIVYNYFYRS